MTHAARVLWGEGLFLRPQHFQQQDAYHDSRLNDAARQMQPFGWGVRNLRLDAEALAAGVLSIQALSLVFPDREPFAAPAADPLPEALQLSSLPDLPDVFMVYAGMAPMRSAGGNIRLDAGSERRSSRFAVQEADCHDLFTEAALAPVSLLQRQVRLLTDRQSLEGWITVPIARLRRSQTGGFEQDHSYIPPLTQIAASMALQAQLRRLLDMLQAKVSALQGLHREPGKHVVEFRSGDIASFWLLHTANSAYATLLHFHQHPQLPPERLFHDLLGLAGGLMTFAKTHTLADLPTYQHDSLTEGFARLDDIIRSLLETVISTRVLRVALMEARPAFWAGRLESDKIDSNTRFYLSVTSSLPAAELIDNAPTRFKLGAPDDVDKLVLSAMPGVRLTHAAQVPSAIPVRPGCFYFELEPRGPLYERMLQAQSIQIYVPTGFPDIQLELLAVI
jgi:type VI secretion system protein ImpJ